MTSRHRNWTSVFTIFWGGGVLALGYGLGLRRGLLMAADNNASFGHSAAMAFICLGLGVALISVLCLFLNAFRKD